MSLNPAPVEASTVALVGDLHGNWTTADEQYFNDSDVDLILFVGDLGGGTRNDGLNIIRGLSRLQKPTLVFAGNNDAEHLPQLAAELAYQSGRSELLSFIGRSKKSSVLPVGYSTHRLRTPLGEVTLIAGRPLAQGGSQISFPELVGRMYGVKTYEQSIARYRSLVDDASEKILFLAHNGPTGLGGEPSSPWGRDFAINGEETAQLPTDFGDEDLREAVEYARQRDKRVLGVLAGHMHRGRRNARPLETKVTETSYVNAACVPRIVAGEDGNLHHHVRLDFTAQGISVEDKWVTL